MGTTKNDNKPDRSLPTPPSRLFGREMELGTLAAWLELPAARLITLSGPGGVGKTALAVALAWQVAPSFDQIYFVDLTATLDPAFFLTTLASASGVKEQSDKRLFEQLQSLLQTGVTLIILDNFEQIVKAAPELAALIEACPNLKVVVTSRTTLGLRAEREFVVKPLTLPDTTRSLTPAVLENSAAVQFFVSCAQRSLPNFEITTANSPLIAEICQKLDGLPLALELAAPHLKMLTPKMLLGRLSSQLSLLVGGAQDLPLRQQTLRTTLDWSYNLLAEPAQILLRWLSVFAGGWQLEACETVCTGGKLVSSAVFTALEQLVNNSLVQLMPLTNLDNEIVRYNLPETIRQYAVEQLAGAGEATEAARRHLNWVLEFSQVAATALWDGNKQLYWLNLLESDHANLSAALSWASFYDRAAMAQLVANLPLFWDGHGHLSEGQHWLNLALTQEQVVPLAVRAQLYFAAGYLAHRRSEFSQAVNYLNTAARLFQQVDDYIGVGRVMLNQGWVSFCEGNLIGATRLLEETLQIALKFGDVACQAAALSYLGLVKLIEGKYEQAEPLCAESVALCRKTGSSQYLGWALCSLGAVALFKAEFNKAAQFFRESVNWLLELGDRLIISYNLLGLAASELLQGRPKRAARLFGTASALRDTVGLKLLPVFQQPYELALIFMATLLDETTIEELWQEGYRLSLGEALDFEKINIELTASEVVEPVRAEADTQSISEKVASSKTEIKVQADTLTSTARNSAASQYNLTPRELEVLRLLSKGLTNAQIAKQLVLSTLTINTYLRTIYAKLEVSSRSAATRLALELGLV